MEDKTKCKFNIYVKIVSHNIYKESYFTRYVMFNINICTNGKNWEVQRRYKNFDDLHNKLSKKISNLPKLPPKKIFISDDMIKERKQNLQKYLNILLKREDIYRYNEIFEFIEMEKDYYLLLKEKLDDKNINSNFSTLSSENEKKKSIIGNLQRCKSQDVLLNENFFYANKSDQPRQFGHNSFIDNTKTSFSGMDFIFKFLKDLNRNIKEKCSIIKKFDEKFRLKKDNHVFHRDEVYKLLFGEKSGFGYEESYYFGLIYHCGNIKDNVLGAEVCVEFLSKLIDCEYNPDYELFTSILKLATSNQIENMKLETHILKNKIHLVNACFTLLKCLQYSDKGKEIKITKFIKNQDIMEQFINWLEY